MELKQKVVAYVTRGSGADCELLIFEHVDFPEAGIQVPAGTIEPQERPADAAKREVLEEAGLILASAPTCLGTFPYFREDTRENQLRHVYHFATPGDLPDNWEHSVTGYGVDESLLFRFYWLPLDKARARLAVGQGDYLPMIASTPK